MTILLYNHMFLLHEEDKYMLIDSDFLYQWLFSVPYSYLLLPRTYFSPGELLSTGTGCWEGLPSLHPWRYLKLNQAWHSASWWKVEAGLLWAGVEPSRDPFLPESLQECGLFTTSSVPPNSIFFPTQKKQEVINGFKAGDILLAYPVGIVFSNISFSLTLSTKLLFLLFLPEGTT